MLHRFSLHERRRAGGLEAQHPRPGAGLREPPPVGGDVASVPDWDAQRLELAVQVVEQLERRRLLTLDTELVNGVHERNRLAVGQLAHEPQGLVEVALQRYDPSAVHQRLRKLAGGNLALGDDHRAPQPGPGGAACSLNTGLILTTAWS